MIVALDAGPLGIASSPSVGPESLRCDAWLRTLIARGHRVTTSELCDYEVRRELVRAGKAASIARLDRMALVLDFLTVDRPTLRRAAELWAEARRRGRPTADPSALDVDVILAAQIQLLAEATGEPVVVATANVRHLGQFVDARRWPEIAP